MTSRTWSSILCIGMMRAACAMAASSPASRHSCRNTLLSTWRIAGLSPKLTFESPSTVDDPGSSVFTRRIASMVSMPSPRSSSCPEPSGNVSMSKIRSVGSIPYFSVASV